MRLIDADALTVELMDCDLDHLQRDDWKEVIQIVADAPTIESMRKKKEWIDRGKDVTMRWEFPVCGRRDNHIYNFCPDCGEDLRW